MSVHEDVPAEEWEAWADANDALVLDVRSPREWALGTLPGAVLIGMEEIPARITELPNDKAILVVCRSGNRSGKVARFLVHQGYQTVANMTGGMKALGLQR